MITLGVIRSTSRSQKKDAGDFDIHRMNRNTLRRVDKMSKIFTIERYLHAFPGRPDTPCIHTVWGPNSNPILEGYGLVLAWKCPHGQGTTPGGLDMHIIKKGKERDKR
jgi:hypothetical protein